MNDNISNLKVKLTFVTEYLNTLYLPCINNDIFLFSGLPTKGWSSRGRRPGHPMRRTKSREFIDTNYGPYTNRMNRRYYELWGK